MISIRNDSTGTSSIRRTWFSEVPLGTSVSPWWPVDRLLATAGWTQTVGRRRLACQTHQGTDVPRSPQTTPSEE
jgi:hypothetical protein